MFSQYRAPPPSKSPSRHSPPYLPIFKGPEPLDSSVLDNTVPFFENQTSEKSHQRPEYTPDSGPHDNSHTTTTGMSWPSYHPNSLAPDAGRQLGPNETHKPLAHKFSRLPGNNKVVQFTEDTHSRLENSNYNAGGNEDHRQSLLNDSSDMGLLKPAHTNSQEFDEIKARVAKNRARFEALEHGLLSDFSSFEITQTFQPPIQIHNSRILLRKDHFDENIFARPQHDKRHDVEEPVLKFRNAAPLTDTPTPVYYGSPAQCDRSKGSEQGHSRPKSRRRVQGQQFPTKIESPIHTPRDTNGIREALEVEVEAFRTLHDRDTLGVLASRLSKEFTNLYSFVPDMIENDIMPHSEPFRSPASLSSANQRARRDHIDSLDSACLALKDFLHQICQNDVSPTSMLGDDQSFTNEGFIPRSSPISIKKVYNETPKHLFEDGNGNLSGNNDKYFKSPSTGRQANSPVKLVQIGVKSTPSFSQHHRKVKSDMMTPLPQFNLPSFSSSGPTAWPPNAGASSPMKKTSSCTTNYHKRHAADGTLLYSSFNDGRNGYDHDDENGYNHGYDEGNHRLKADRGKPHQFISPPKALHYEPRLVEYGERTFSNGSCHGTSYNLEFSSASTGATFTRRGVNSFPESSPSPVLPQAL